jgi:hypothetical protein
MFSTVVEFFQDSTWMQLIDYATFGLIARYTPNLLPTIQSLFVKKR